MVTPLNVTPLNVTPLQHATPPGSVTALLTGAVRGDLLTDVDALAGVLSATGWVREVGSGSWTCRSDPAWSVQSSGFVPSVSIFAAGDHDLLLQAAATVAAWMGSGAAGGSQPGAPDPDWRTWTGEHVVVSLTVGPPRPLGGQLVPATLHLALERPTAPAGELPLSPDDAHRLRREGTPVARWYLAGVDEIPDDVVALLADDEDPAVVAAVAENAEHRRVTLDHR